MRRRDRVVIALLAARAVGLAAALAAAPGGPAPRLPGVLELLAPGGVLLGLGALVARRRRR